MFSKRSGSVTVKGVSQLVLVVLGLAAAVSQFGCGANPVVPGAGKTTVLVYIIGSNLESDDAQATGNIEEMKKATLGSSVNVVLTTGGAKKDGWKTVKRQLVQNGQVQELADLGALDMGTPATLKEFIVWGQTTYPADKFLLVLWNHGGGPIGGYGPDENTNSRFSIPEIRQVLTDATATTKKTFEIIGFDACLMATAEIAYNLSPFAKYMVASEELEPGAGWDYTVFLNSVSVPSADGLSIGTAIADGFAAKCKKNSDESYTLSVTDLSKVGSVVTELDNLGAQMKDRILLTGRSAWVAVAGARNQTDEYGADYVSKKYFYNTADIANFTAQLDITDTTYAAATASVRSALGQAVKYAVKGIGHPMSNGLAFYLPYHNFKEAASSLPTYKSVTFPLNYQTMVETYTQYPLLYPANPPLNASAITVAGSKLSAGVVSPYGLANQYLGLMKFDAVANTVTMLGMDIATATSTGVGIYTVGYTRTDKWFTLQGNPVTVIIDMKGNSATTYSIAVPVFHRRAGTAVDQNKPVNLGILYDYQTNIGQIVSAWEGVLPNGSPDRIDVKLKDNDIITPAFSVFSMATGEWGLVGGTPFSLTTTAFQFAQTAITPGTYTFYFQVEDLTGTTVLSSGVDLAVPMAAVTKGIEPKPSAISTIPTTTEGFWSSWKP